MTFPASAVTSLPGDDRGNQRLQVDDDSPLCRHAGRYFRECR